MSDGEVPRDVLRPAQVPRRRLSAAAVDGARLAGRIITSRMLDGDRDRRRRLGAQGARSAARGSSMSDSLITCTCGSTLREDTREPVGPLSARGAGCAHGRAAKSGVRPTESKMGRAVETK